jgi:hypothetical protein
LSKIPRENALARDPLAPRGPFFSTAGGTPMRTHNRAINAPELLVKQACGDILPLQSSENFTQRSVCIPLIKSPPRRFARAEFCGQVAPGRSRPQNPQDPIENRSQTARRSPGCRASLKHIAN